jgi:hypothetical protein
MRERSMGYTANVDSDQSLLPHVVDNRLVAHKRLPNKDGEDFTTESEPNSPKILAKDLVQVHTRTGGHVSSMKTTEPEERSASNTDKLLQKQLRMGLFSIACSAAGFACYSFLSQPGIQGSLPKVPEWLAPGIAFTAAGLIVMLGLAKATFMRDTLHLELHRGRLYVQVGVPSHGPPRPAGSIKVLPTEDGRGNGAFATMAITKGSYLCDYEGDLLNRQEFESRYPDGVGDFATGIDEEWTLDAAPLVKDTSTFHAVHMNHSRYRSNVCRYYHRGAQRVSFFAARDIAGGEELLYDYGRGYWRGREGLELP